MLRNASLALIVAGSLSALAGCRDSTSAGPLALMLSASIRSTSVNEDSASVQTDSAVVSLSGVGATAATWSATHGSASWITVLTSSGAASGMVRWRRDPTGIPPGNYVDTITVSVNRQSGGAARIVESLTVRQAWSEFISVRRAWMPGERDARIASIVANREWVFPYVGDISDLAPVVLSDPDSVVVVVANPLPPAGPSARLRLAPKFSSGWDIFGLDVRIIDTTQVPADTNDWLGTFWSNPAEQTQKGIVLAYRCSNLTSPALESCQVNRNATHNGNIAVTTTTFDASGAKSGAGGGERRFTTGEYWEATSGNFRVTAAAYGSASTVTSGPFTGGTSATGSMLGRMQNIVMPRLLPTVDGSSITVDFDFRGTAIGAMRLTCLFSFPCTGQAGAALASPGRGLQARREDRR